MEDREYTQFGRILDKLEDMHHRLFGNGQPGELAEIKGRLTAQEEFKNKVLGAFVVLGIMVSVVGAALFQHILKGH